MSTKQNQKKQNNKNNTSNKKKSLPSKELQEIIKLRKAFNASSKPTKEVKSKNPNDMILSNAKNYGMYRSMLMSDPNIASFQAVYEHPWSKRSARIPTFPVSESQLTRVFVLASGVCNSSGYGFALATVSNSITNDLPALAYSNGLGAPNQFQSAGTDVTQSTTNSEFGSDAFTNEDQREGWKVMRPVAAGLRVKYIGTNLNRSGLCYSVQNSPRALALDGFAVSEIIKRPYKLYNFSNYGWHAITRHINDTNDFKYQQYSGVNDIWNYETDTASQITMDDYWNLGIFIVAEPGAQFEIEYVAHFEIKGKNLHRTAVVNPNTAGIEQVVSKSTLLRQKDNTTPDYSPKEKGGASNIIKDIAEGFAGAVFDL